MTMLSIFIDYSMVSTILIFVALLISLLGVFVSSYTFYGISSFCMILCSLIIEVFNDSKFEQVLVIAILLVIETILFVVLFIRNLKDGKIQKSIFVQTQTSVPEYINSPNKDLIGKVGYTVSDCKPVGKVRIGEAEYDAITNAVFLKRNTQVIVSKVIDNVIYIDVV